MGFLFIVCTSSTVTAVPYIAPLEGAVTLGTPSSTGSVLATVDFGITYEPEDVTDDWWVYDYQDLYFKFVVKFGPDLLEDDEAFRRLLNR